MSQYSRENYLPVVNIGAQSYMDIVKAKYVEMQKYLSVDSVYTVEGQYEGYPELISYKFYGTTELWWILCMYNSIIDPISEIVAGVDLKIPSLASIDNYLSTLVGTRIGSLVEV